jgi:ornithine carbamoyltransferase
MLDGIEYRGFGHDNVETLGRCARAPVWNGLTTEWHPTQMLADILTMTGHTVKHLGGIAYCYLGDARNNTARSLLGGRRRRSRSALPDAPAMMSLP